MVEGEPPGPDASRQERQDRHRRRLERDHARADNRHTFTRTHGLITEDDAVAQLRLFADAAHAVGLPIAQKNSAEITGRRTEMGTDFAVAEECNRWHECD